MKPTRVDQDRDRGLDWSATRQRLDAVVESLEDWERLSPEQARRVLAERARALARVPPDQPGSKDILEVMTFRLANERFAVEARFIREVLRSFDCTPVPGGPAHLVGVTNLRGHVLAVLDLCSYFNLQTGDGERSWVLVVGAAGAEFGILADDVDQVTMLRVDQILPPPGSVSAIAREYLRGVTSDALLVLKADALLADERLIIDQSE